MTATSTSVAAETVDEVAAVLLDPERPYWIARHGGRVGASSDNPAGELAGERIDLAAETGERRKRR